MDKVWLAWTENPKDELARKLRKEQQAMRMALTAAGARMAVAGSPDPTLDGLLQLFGAAGQGTTGDALKVVRALCAEANLRFASPPTHRSTPRRNRCPRLYVLGPPHDEPLIKRYIPSKSQPETYGHAAAYLDHAGPRLYDPDVYAPFDPILQIPDRGRRSRWLFFRTTILG